MRLIAISLILAAFCFASCNKNRKKVTPKPAIQEEVVEPDTALIQDSTMVEETIPEEPLFKEEEIQEPVKSLTPTNDRYFLISASFSEYANAEKYQQTLINQGLSSEIITRREGANKDFYKVSYLSFSNYREALQKLEEERNTPGKEQVWLLVKK